MKANIRINQIIKLKIEENRNRSLKIYKHKYLIYFNKNIYKL